MNRFFLLFFLLFDLYSYAANQSIWNYQYSFNLKKDKIATVYISRQQKSEKKRDTRYLLKFRWTLYDGSKNLFVFLNYMGHPNQYILKKERHLDRIRIKLLPDGRDYNGKTYAVMVFANFDDKKRVATMEIYIKDEMKRVKVEFKPPKEK